jgi:hypothetical protein
MKFASAIGDLFGGILARLSRNGNYPFFPSPPVHFTGEALVERSFV